MEVKRPIPQIPAPVWTEFKDLQEWEKYHQSRAEDDKTSNALASIADAIHQRLFEARALRIDESALTGESRAIDESA
jgi:hypothetical protein